jgi:hypothetical protein
MKGVRSCCGRGWLVSIKCWKRYPHPRTPFIAIGTYTKTVQKEASDIYAMRYIELEATAYLETDRIMFQVHNKSSKQFTYILFQLGGGFHLITDSNFPKNCLLLS